MKNFLKETLFDEVLTINYKKSINTELRNYIIKNILSEYDLNDSGHDINHINYVLNRAIEISEGYELNKDILYICVVFHDIACHIDRDNHEILSAKRAYDDKFLNSFFSTEQMITIKEAIEDHRASLEYVPRNIYGKILSSADRKIGIKAYLVASMAFDIKKYPELSKEEIINESYNFAIKKYGKNGYAVIKSYVDDEKYKQFLEDLQYLIENKDIYFKNASIIYDEIITKKYKKHRQMVI